jgi:multicomponent K+:H+ antiporter subunit E/multicomponent Na+:H+ antiporter subunit E
MALASLRLRPLSDAGIVAVPVDPDDPRAALIAWAETISPGSVLVDVDHERGRLLFHVFDASAPHELWASLERKHGCWSGR